MGPSPTNPPTYHHGNLRHALVAEGRKIFEEFGATELSLREVARRVGVSVAAPSRHFKGKEELLAAIASDGFRELLEQREKTAAEGLEPLAEAREMMSSYIRFALLHGGLFSLMIGPRILEEFRHQELLPVSSESFNYFANSIAKLALANGWRKSDLQYLFHAAWAMEHGVAALILAQMVPRTGSGIELQKMIDFSINAFLSAVMAGPKALSAVRKRVL